MRVRKRDRKPTKRKQLSLLAKLLKFKDHHNSNSPCGVSLVLQVSGPGEVGGLCGPGGIADHPEPVDDWKLHHLKA